MKLIYPIHRCELFIRQNAFYCGHVRIFEIRPMTLAGAQTRAAYHNWNWVVFQEVRIFHQ